MLALLAATALCLPLHDDGLVNLKVMSRGASSKLGGYRPQHLMLSASKPDTLKSVPEGLEAPMYGVLKTAGADNAVFHVILDEPDGKPARLFVDANGNGNLNDDPEVSWKGTAGKGQQYMIYNGAAKLNLGTSDQPFDAGINLYRFDKSDPGRAGLKDTILYYRDYAVEGDLQLGDKSYHILISDDLTSGDFRGTELPPGADAKASSGVTLFIDVNANGKVDRRGEEYDVRKPFNIGGTTYELRDVARNGLSFQLKKSAHQVAEIPLPPDHSVGKKITPFQAKSTKDKIVSFPGDYKGRIVMLDFWATWCGPCMQEVPNLVKVYNAYHDQGFEVLGVSLDNDKTVSRLEPVTADKGMTWTQICDAKYWDAEIAQLYVVRGIPDCFLVDGDTGEILATAAGLRGDKLEETVKQALARKKARG